MCRSLVLVTALFGASAFASTTCFIQGEIVSPLEDHSGYYAEGTTECLNAQGTLASESPVALELTSPSFDESSIGAKLIVSQTEDGNFDVATSNLMPITKIAYRASANGAAKTDLVPGMYTASGHFCNPNINSCGVPLAMYSGVQPNKPTGSGKAEARRGTTANTRTR